MTQSNESPHRSQRGRLATRILSGLLAAAVLAACERAQPVGPDRAAPDAPSLTLNPACDPGLGGTTHTDSVLAPETWARANNPHRVNTFINIEGSGVLTLQPGVIVCFGIQGALLAENGGRLAATGLDTSRIVLTATDPDDGWWGVQLADTPSAASTLKHVRLEHTYPAYALSSHDHHAVHIDSTVFRQNENGLYLWGRGTTMRRSRVDTVVSASEPAVQLGNVVTWEKNVIRGAAGVGLFVQGTNGITLLGGRIEGSGGVGLKVTTTGAGFVDADPVRVTGGAGYPVELVVSAFPRIYPALADQDSLLGNARDTVVVTGGLLKQWALPGPAIPWRVTGDIDVQDPGILIPKPGAVLVFDSAAGITATNGGRVLARGTAAAPVLFTGSGWDGVVVEGAPTLGSYLTNVRMEHALLAAYADGNHPLVIDSAVFRQNGRAISLWSAGSRLSRSRVDTTLTYGYPSVLLAADAILASTLIRGSAYDGVWVYSDAVQVQSCEVRESAWFGFLMWWAVPLHNSNLEDNLYGVVNLDTDTADAENNWWGDAAGPTGPNGDPVNGAVDYTPWRTTPYTLPYVP
ncbi:MAG TPA: right-handed parallel beta-helix repeat-containing protein [Longimicrobium sp.]|nr:right-handed parallel beta-helix repeat-containing protein [Longimicrobium sp.]